MIDIWGIHDLLSYGGKLEVFLVGERWCALVKNQYQVPVIEVYGLTLLSTLETCAEAISVNDLEELANAKEPPRPR